MSQNRVIHSSFEKLSLNFCFVMKADRYPDYHNFAVAEPLETKLDKLKFYNIAGLINSEPIEICYNTGKVLQRVSFITPQYTTAIVEIWNSTKDMQPHFCSNWKNLQFMFMKHAVFHGLTHMGNKSVPVFRISQKFPETRYIWLSNNEDTFWNDPVSQADPEYNPTLAEVNNLHYL